MAAADDKKPARAWCFTTNNPTRTNLFPDGLPEGIKYAVWQLEKGEQGTPHLQGFVQLTRAQRMSWLKNVCSKDAEGCIFHVFDRAHLAVAKGTADQNKKYCTKPEGRVEGPWELGAATKQGDRTDLREAAEALLATGDIRSVDAAIFLKYASGCLKLAALAQPPYRPDLKVFTITGTTGVGKSYAVHHLFEDKNLYVVNMGNSGLWWDGYVGQKVVLLEEYKGQIQLQKLLQILDPYPLRVEVKGGCIPARFEVIFITSNSTPDLWYRNEGGLRDAEMQALARRLDYGNPASIPPRPDGPRYMVVNTRNELMQKLRWCMALGLLTPETDFLAEKPADAAAAAAPPTAPASPSPSPPPLRRQNCRVLDEPDEEEHSASFFAPQP